MERVQLDSAITGELEHFDSFVSRDNLCVATRTIGLKTSPIATHLAGEVATAKARGAAVSARLDPVLRRLGYHSNRLCTAEDASAYFLADGGVLHRIVATRTGGRVDSSPNLAGLPGWPATASPLATLITVRDQPRVLDVSPCLLACDGSSQLWVCDEAGGTVGGAIPLPLPHGYSVADGWEHWLAVDAAWSDSSTSVTGRVDCVLLGYRAASQSARCWSVLVVTICLPSATSAPSLSAAALSTQAEPLYMHCGPTPGAVRCLLVVPHEWGGCRSDSQPPAANSSGVEALGGQSEPGSDDKEEVQAGGSERDEGGESVADQGETVDGPVGFTIDSYSAVELQPDPCGSMQLFVRAEQPLDGFRPMADPGCQDLCAGGVLMCTTSRPLSLRHAPTEQPLLVDPHAHVFEWQESLPQNTEVASLSAEDVPGGKVKLLRHVAAVGALGYVCSARPQRRFVVLSRRHGFVFVAENRLVTVFALPPSPHSAEQAQEAEGQPTALDAGSRLRLPSQVWQILEELGDLVGLAIVEPPQPNGSAESACSSCSGGAVSAPDATAVLLVLGTAGVSAVQLRRPAAQDLAAQAAPAAASASLASEEMKALRLRALELLAGDGEW